MPPSGIAVFKNQHKASHLLAFPIREGCVSGIAASSFHSLPHWGRGTAPAVDRVLSYIVDLRRISSLSFIPLSPSNLRPFGAPPSIGRRERPREPLPLEGAAERSEAGLASFFAAKPPPLCLPPWGRRCVEKSGILVSQPSPLGKGDRAAVDRVLSLMAHLRRSSSLFFIPLEPYPARSARHLPHAGKALFRG